MLTEAIRGVFLFVACGADADSLTFVKEALDELYQFSGPQSNLQKSSISFSSVGTDLQTTLYPIQPIPIGHLPVKYLSVPLISARLTMLIVYKESHVESQDLDRQIVAFRGKRSTTSSVCSLEYAGLLVLSICFSHKSIDFIIAQYMI